MPGTRVKLVIAALLVATATTLVTSLAAASSGGTGTGQHDHKGYVNPFKPARWYEGRIDMGVDYVPDPKARRGRDR